MAGVISERELSARSKSRKMMVFDPETGCYRKKSEIEDEEALAPEIKSNRVEYQFRIGSDEAETGQTETTSEDIPVFQGSVTTERSIMVNGKNRSKGQEGISEDDLKKGGDPMTENSEEQKKKSAKEPSERKRTTRAMSDESLEEKIREMEKRRERLLLRGLSFEAKESPSESPDKEDDSPRGEPDSPRSLGEDGSKKKRSRSERNKRRLTAEKLSRTKSEDDVLDGSRSSSSNDKAPKIDNKEETFTIQLNNTSKKIENKEETLTIQLNQTENPDEVFVKQEKPVEAGLVDLMTWDDDSTDGRSSPQKDPPEAFRKRADSTDGETFPKPINLVEIEAPITVTEKEKVQNAPVNNMDIDNDDDEDSDLPAQIIESISTWDNKARASNTADEDRKRREKEHEERKRRIEENQRRAAQELKAKKHASVEVNEKEGSEEPFSEMTMKEKRRSLVDMWESFSEAQTQVTSFQEDEIVPQKRSRKILERDNRTISFDPTGEDDGEERGEVDITEAMSSSRPVVVESNEKLTDEEQRWESAEKFQPGRLQKTVFHGMTESAPVIEESNAKPHKGPSRYDWMKGESYADQEALVPTKLKLGLQSNQETQEIPRKSPVQSSSPQPVQMVTKTEDQDSESSSEESESGSESPSESESKEERKPRIDTDEYHKLTEEEKQWESAGHFQPKKLNIALMSSFQQTPTDDGGFRPAPRKTQEGYSAVPKNAPDASPLEQVTVSNKPQSKMIEVEKISPVLEVKAETQPVQMVTKTEDQDAESSCEESESGSESSSESESKEERKPRIDTDEYHKLTEDEKQWESAGHFQPKKLNIALMSSFQQAPTDEGGFRPAPRKTQEGSRAVPKKAPDASPLEQVTVPNKPQSKMIEVEKISPVHEVKAETQPVQMVTKTEDQDAESSSEESESGSESSSESESKEERKPRIDTDEYHKLTEDEKQWESAGHFQPKKLNIALMSSFQQAPTDEGGFRPAHRKTQEGSRAIPKKAPDASPLEQVTVPIDPQRKMVEVEKISPVHEVKAETQPEAFVSNEESESEEEIPGWRKVEEQRRKQEKEEIERAKLEEKLRMEREAMEEDKKDQSDSSDDEFEAKVRTKEIRRINPNLLVQFLTGDEKEPEKPAKLVKLKTEDAGVESSSSDESEDEEEGEEMEEQSQEPRPVEDEYEEKVKSRQIGKLRIDNSPFFQAREDTSEVSQGSKIVLQKDPIVQKVAGSVAESAPPADFDVRRGYANEPDIDSGDGSSEEESDSGDDVPEWRKIEEKRRKQEQEEIERAKLEEQRRREREAVESENEDTEPLDDEFEAKVRTKEIRKINPNVLFQFMGQAGEKENPSSFKREEKEAVEVVQVKDETTSSSEESDADDDKEKAVAGEEDVYETKVKSGQVRKLVLNNSPFYQMTTKEEPQMIDRRFEAKIKIPEPIVQEEALVQVVDDKVVESEPDILFQEPQEGGEYEVKVKSRAVRKLSEDQFGFLRKQEEDERRKSLEKERLKAEREEREMLRKEEERRRRLEAEARAKEEEKILKEEELKRQKQKEKDRKEEERKRKIEEAERVRREEEERVRREEEEEQMRLEEMRRQKLEAKKKFESGVFDEVSVNHTEKDIYSVRRLDSNIFLQFQKTSSEEPKQKSKGKSKEKKENKIPEPETETVVVTSVDLIETSPYDERFDIGPSEDLEYEEKRKKVGKLDKDWFMKQQERQAEEQHLRTRELEEQRLREEKNEMLRVKQEKSHGEGHEPNSEALEKSGSEKTRNKLSNDNFGRGEKDEKVEKKKSRKKKDKSKKEKKSKSKSSEDGSDFVPVHQDEETAHLKMRLQRERDESELLRQEEERRQLAIEEEQYTDDKPKSVGKLNQQQFLMFQQKPPTFKESKKSENVEEIVQVQSHSNVESAPVNIDEALEKEDAEYELKINKGKKLDVDKYLSWRSQEALEGEKRKKKLAEERVRQEQEELAKLRAEEKKRLMKKQEPVDEEYDDEDIGDHQKLELDLERPEEDKADKRVSVGRLPDHFRSTFEGDTSKKDKSGSRRKSDKNKDSKSQQSDSQSKSSRSSSYDSLSYACHDRDLNGAVSPRENEPLEETSTDRSDSNKDAQLKDRPIESSATEEKPVPKKLGLTMFAAFEKSDLTSDVKLRRAKSEKKVRPKSVGNVDLLLWKDDGIIPSSSGSSKKEKKTGSLPRPKSIAF
ncbi:trichohyalin-like isoform X3 [Montipora capricornis]